MNKKKAIAGALSCSLILSGCAADGSISNKDVARGALGCIVLGGLALATKQNGSTVAAACAGGAVLAITIGQLLDDREKQQLRQASLRAAASGQRTEWGAGKEGGTASQAGAPAAAAPLKPSKHHKKGTPAAPASSTASNAPPAGAAATGWVVPGKTFVKNGQTCRNLEQHATKGDKSAVENVTACQTASGWVLPNQA